MKKSLEIHQRASFEYIRYANCWEDPELLIKGLGITSKSVCLSIASAGDNSLALLSCSPELVVAVDLSQVQLACVDLRKIAFEILDYEDLLGFLGARESKGDRKKTYQQIRSRLRPQTVAFWDQRLEQIEGGMIHGGKFEKYFHLFRTRILPFVQGKKRIRQLFEPKEKGERVAFYNKYWNHWRWRLMFRFFFSRYLIGKLGRDPEFFRYVEGTVASRMFDRTAYALTEIPIVSNPYLRYIFVGNYEDALPFYLRREPYERIRKNLERLELFQGTTDQALEFYGKKFDCYNLSDIFEYMGPDLFKGVAGRLLDSASPRARLAYWNLFVPRRIEEILPERVVCLKEISEGLFRQDQAFFYSAFYIDEVRS